MTTFINLSYIIASTIKVKSELLGEEFATSQEINLIFRKMQEELTKNNVNAIMTNNIDSEFFSYKNNIFIPKVSMEELESRFQGYIPLEANIIIWNNKNLIIDCILEIKKEQLIQLQNGINVNEDISSTLKLLKMQK